jgi:hypothetical protein
MRLQISSVLIRNTSQVIPTPDILNLITAAITTRQLRNLAPHCRSRGRSILRVEQQHKIPAIRSRARPELRRVLWVVCAVAISGLVRDGWFAVGWVLVEGNEIGVFQNVEMGFGEGVQLFSCQFMLFLKEVYKG